MLLFDPIWILISALLALLIDRLFGEFLGRAHPVVGIGKLISAFERRFYRDSISRGALLVVAVSLIVFLLASIVGLILIALPLWLSLILSAIITSTLFAHRMLYDSVRALINDPQPQKALAMLVSRDTAQLNQSDCYKAGIETYAENLSDGVIAPLFYFILFGLPGLVVYKAINTLDSMVGYRTERYENYGKIAARLDDLANWIPARLTAGLILLLNKQYVFKDVWRQARGHASPNAGYPIAAMAWVCKTQLGGPTQYFGELHEKPLFGDPNSVHEVDETHLKCALSNRTPIDFSLWLLILLGMLPYAV